uniref:Uncharacterized protein n=1 Tax=Diplonema ambulator TaxID=182243 RepID=A0A2D2AJU0_9EUGL|nr:hypothetical protein [Diplonema ambulator]
MMLLLCMLSCVHGRSTAWVWALVVTMTSVHTLTACTVLLVLCIAAAAGYVLTVYASSSSTQCSYHVSMMWLLLSICIDTLVLMHSAVPHYHSSMICIMWCIKGWCMPSAVLALSMYTALSAWDISILLLLGYAQLLVLLPLSKFFFFFFFFFYVLLQLAWVIPLLLAAYTVDSMLIAASIYSSILLLGSMLTVSSIATSYIVLVASMATLVIWHVLLLSMNATVSISTVSTATCLHRYWVLSYVAQTAGLPIWWYSIAKLDIMLGLLATAATFFFFFLYMLCMLWAYRVYAAVAHDTVGTLSTCREHRENVYMLCASVLLLI